MQVTTRGLRPVLRLWSSSWEEIKAVVNSVLLVGSAVLARLGVEGRRWEGVYSAAVPAPRKDISPLFIGVDGIDG